MTKVLQYDLPVTIRAQPEGGYLAECPVWTECYAQGETIEEAALEITAVAQSLIELYNEENKKIPLKKIEESTISSKPISVPLIVTV